MRFLLRGPGGRHPAQATPVVPRPLPQSRRRCAPERANIPQADRGPRAWGGVGREAEVGRLRRAPLTWWTDGASGRVDWANWGVPLAPEVSLGTRSFFSLHPAVGYAESWGTVRSSVLCPRRCPWAAARRSEAHRAAGAALRQVRAPGCRRRRAPGRGGAGAPASLLNQRTGCSCPGRH